ncbi:hypothetical protein D4R99_04620 [bacterium]|nr:MAG: hypothetical protein D4R99_04620 [bacterium]
MGISAIRERSNRFVVNLPAIIAEALNENEDAFVQLNQEAMLNSMKSDGGRIEPAYRSQAYADKKGRNYPDLKLTGAFQGDMSFFTDGEEFFLTSNDPKMPKLVDKYTLKIFGIAPIYRPLAQGRALSTIARMFNKYVLNG